VNPCGRKPSWPVKLELGGKGGRGSFSNDVTCGRNGAKLDRRNYVPFRPSLLRRDPVAIQSMRSTPSSSASAATNAKKIPASRQPARSVRSQIGPRQRETVPHACSVPRTTANPPARLCVCVRWLGRSRRFYTGHISNPPCSPDQLDNVAGPRRKFRPGSAVFGEILRPRRSDAWQRHRLTGLAKQRLDDDQDRAARVAEAMVRGNSWINATNVFAKGVLLRGAVNKKWLWGRRCPLSAGKRLMDYYR